ncbi:MAG TPA: type VI secretion system contractile sheath small subunit [Mucilaginibacter sp.]|nr:type VI secretion system contractile sheath small subunit [Mucilaginibacter sp.]
MFNYEIGGNETKVDTSEAFGEIAPNKTLFIQKLTDNEPLRPEKVEGLKNVEAVFAHYKPKVSVELEKESGSSVTETLHFNNLGDFSPRNLVQQSKYLHKLNIQREMYLNIMKQLKTNKTLKSTLDNAETKQAFIEALKSIVTELDQ